MTVAILLAPLVASLLLFALAEPIGRRLPPAVGVRCLSLAALVTALSSGFVLSVLGLTALAEWAPFAQRIGWSASALEATEPLPGPVAGVAGLVAAVLLIAAGRRAVHSILALRQASQLCAELGPDAGGLVVTDDARADAYAVRGLWSGRIVVSRPMLQALSVPEQRVLLAHEAAHLHQRHHIYVIVVDLCVAANPLLRPLGREVAVGVERWADEIAAADSGDRKLAAQALARAGLARMGSAAAGPQPALGATEVDLPRRVNALLADSPRRRPLLAAVVVALVLTLVGTSAATAQNTRERLVHADSIFDHR